MGKTMLILESHGLTLTILFDHDGNLIKSNEFTLDQKTCMDRNFTQNQIKYDEVFSDNEGQLYRVLDIT